MRVDTDPDREPRRGAARRLPGAGGGARGRRPSPSTWSAAPSATCCSAAAAPTSTWSSSATPAALAARLGAETVEHERFATAKVELDGHEVDIATARTETYPRPGALPEVEPAGSIEADLARRDFTINAMAIPLRGEPRLIDPHGGRADLESRPAAGPARALLRRRPDPGAARGPLRGPLRLRAGAGDRGAAARGRPRAPSPPTAARPSCCGSPPNRARREAFGLLAEWGLVELREGGVELADAGRRAARAPPWASCAPSATGAVLAAALGPPGGERGAGRRAARSARRRRSRWPPATIAVELVLARALRRRVARRLPRASGARSSSRSTART